MQFRQKEIKSFELSAKIVAGVLAVTLIVTCAVTSWQVFHKQAKAGTKPIACNENLDCGEFNFCDMDYHVCRAIVRVDQVYVKGEVQEMVTTALIFGPSDKIEPLCFDPPSAPKINCLPENTPRPRPNLHPAVAAGIVDFLETAEAVGAAADAFDNPTTP